MTDFQHTPLKDRKGLDEIKLAGKGDKDLIPGVRYKRCKYCKRWIILGLKCLIPECMQQRGDKHK